MRGEGASAAVGPGHARADGPPAHPASAAHLSPILGAALALLSCDAGPATSEPSPPNVHIVDVLAAVSSASGSLVYGSVIGKAGPTVLANTELRLRFDRYLLPLTATRQAICVQALLKQVKKPDDCTDGVQWEPTYDPVLREAVYRQPAAARLTPGAIYKLTALAPKAVGDGGFRAFDGAPLASTFTLEFLVQGDPGVLSDSLPTSDHFCGSPRPTCVAECAARCPTVCAPGPGCANCAQECADACPRSVQATLLACSTSGCHGGPSPAEALDFSSAAWIVATAEGRTAHLTQGGEHATTSDESPLRFGRAMPIVDPSFAGNSFLVYKVLASPSIVLENPPDTQERDRLASGIALGLPMPPTNGTGAALRPGEPEWLSAWIQQGAPLPVCAP